MRNLVLTPPTRPRGKTIDEDDIPTTLKTPDKLRQSETRALHHSRSYTDLNHAPRKDPQGSDDHLEQLRRRSTLPWSAATPEARQGKLEDVVRSRMADTWFSLHCDGVEEPVYISEVVEKSTNPTFRSFDLNLCGPGISRRDELIVKLWAKSEAMAEYALLVELRLSLRSLQFLGKTIETFHQPLPPNSFLFHFADGVYANLTDLPPAPRPSPNASFRGDVQSTSSYDALMRLATLDECIQDALATREKLEAQINQILEENQKSLEAIDRVSQAQERVASAQRAVANEKKQLRNKIRRKEALMASLQARREAMARGRQTQESISSHLPDAESKMAASTSLLAKVHDEASGQIRRICEDLMKIYPIEPIPGKPLAFTIAGLPLPNSTFDDIDRDTVAAALGYTAHLVYLLSFYLSAPIPYPIKPYSSSSVIEDPVSVSLPQRTFPLYPVNVQYRFEYGVFLLNKDIEFLLNRRGVRVLDIRHTLPNLKYLLYVLTAKTTELPMRKAGGIRGLMGPGAGQRTPSTLSRQNSEDSFASSDMTVHSRKMPDSLRLATTSASGADMPKPKDNLLSPEHALHPRGLDGAT